FIQINNINIYIYKMSTTTTSSSTVSTAPTSKISEKDQAIINDIKKIQDEMSAISKEQRKKQVVIERKYNAQLAANYKTRDEMIAKAGVPGFWGTIVTRVMIPNFQPMDQEIVDLIDSISASFDYADDAITKTVVFNFKDNNYFTEKQLALTIKQKLDSEDDQLIVVPAKITYKQKEPASKGNDKKRKETSDGDASKESFILHWLSSSEDTDSDAFEELINAYQDPFSVLADDDDDEDQFDMADFEDDGEDDDEDDEPEEEEPEEVKKPAPKQQAPPKKK
ncbi:hypothetical protein SAMD00019534_117940, partial [Acytostelium subglobosum LB1]|uniref:hypothetical protein n=1 Tax=Acytostelium subglobosum LB1 TaxID=1410327 RepID=UPI0006449404